MSSIVRRKTGKQTYLYESESYRNEEGKPRTRKKLIGKIDLSTGEPLYKPEYLERMQTAGKRIELPKTKELFSIEAIRNSTLKEFGAFYLFENIAKENGLYTVLKEAFPYRFE